MKEYEFRVSTENCDCPPKIVRATTWYRADEKAGSCVHGNKYSAQHSTAPKKSNL